MQIIRLSFFVVLVSLLPLACDKNPVTYEEFIEFDSLSPEDNALVETWSITNPALKDILGADGLPLDRITGGEDAKNALIKAMLTEAHTLSEEKSKSHPQQGTNSPMHSGIAYSAGQRRISERRNPLQGNSLHKKYAVYGTDCSGLIYNLFKNNGPHIANFKVATFKSELTMALERDAAFYLVKVKELKIPASEIQSGDFILWFGTSGNHMGICFKTINGSKGVYQCNGTANPRTENEQTKNLGLNCGVHPINLTSATTGNGFWANDFTVIRLDYDVYKGSLAQTNIIPIGGQPYCNYDVQFRDMKMAIDSALYRAELHMVFEERIVGSCPFLPIGIVNMKFLGNVYTPGTNEISVQFDQIVPYTYDVKVSYQGVINGNKIIGKLTIIRNTTDPKFDYRYNLDIVCNK